MDRSDFVAADGTVWHIVAGLPADHPDAGEGLERGDPRAGLTFRSDDGEVRVLPRAVIPRHVKLPAVVPAPPGTRAPVTRVEVPGWEDLLRIALRWPPV